MSIADQITRLQGAKADLKASIEAKGVTVPSDALIDEYPALVDAIPQGGGGGGVPEKDVNFYDYDGTCVYSYTKSEFLTLSALPANPDHTDEGFVNDGWNWDLTSAKNYVTDFGKCHIGQTYHLADNIKFSAEIELASDPCTIILKSIKTSVSAGATIDWGDGTTTQSAASTNTVDYSHIYSGVSRVTLRIFCSSGTVEYYNSSATYCIFGTYTSLHIKKLGKVIVSGIGCSLGALLPKRASNIGSSENVKATGIQIDKLIVLSTFTNTEVVDPDVTIARAGTQYAGAGAAQKVISLSKDTTVLPPFKAATVRVACLPRTLSSIGNQSFINCFNLEEVIAPSIKKVGNNAFQYCRKLTKFTFPEGLTTLGAYSFQCVPLKDVILPSTITAINSAFINANIETITCKAVAPPTITANCLGEAPAHIYVPAASVDNYKAATNWSNYSSIIEAIPIV